jgi:hypothetical protein
MTEEFTAPLIAVADDLDSINALYLERRWGDGLPVVPPTPERVRAMLRYTDRDPTDVVAMLPPGFGAATVERIAINAVLAGCHPSFLPVLIAAVAAMAEPRFNLQGIQATTNPVAVFVLINGPAAAQLGVNSGAGCLGPGWQANATIGRALRLIMQNIGGARPGEMDRATHGQPGKYTFCCAENEAASPWEPLHVERGFPPTTSTVTVLHPAGTHNMNTHTKDADDLLRVIADTMAFPTANDYVFGGEPIVLLGPEHAAILAQAGLSKAAVKRRLWEQSKLPGRRFAAKDLARLVIGRREDLPGPIGLETLIPLAPSPDEIVVIVAGGPGTHSVSMTSFGDARSVTRPITDAAGQPIERFGVPVR